MHSIAIFGGTFDPVHNGHIQTSLTIQSNFSFDSYRLLPCRIPIIKPPAFANNTQRIEMLELVINKFNHLNLDLREIERDSPSYMVDTLQSFRSEYKNDSITLIMGYDTFISLPQWHQWKKIIRLANLLVINREKFSLTPIPEPIKELLKNYQVDNKEKLLTTQSGVIYLFDAGDYEISSTELREKLKQHQNISNEMPEEVYNYIKKWGLYQ